MTVDEAFRNLAKNNQLDIPVSGGGGTVLAAVENAQAAKTGAVAANSNTADNKKSDAKKQVLAMRIPHSALVDNAESDYMPPGPEYARPEFKNAPTETDLSPINIYDVPAAAGADSAEAVEHTVYSGSDKPAGGKEKADSLSFSDFLQPEQATGLNVESYDAQVMNLARIKTVKRFAQLAFIENSRLEDAFRNLRIQALGLVEDRPSILITSAWGSEGRTELAIRLALSLAKRNESRVLLADFDIKNPRVAVRLGLSVRQLALLDVLKNSCSPEEAIVRGDEDNLYVLPARANDRDGDDIFDGRESRKLLKNLHANFDITIIDCGPLESDASALMLAGQVGSVILAGRSGFSSAAEITRTAERLSAAGGRVGGVVLIDNG